MKPTFALDFRNDALTLLHRAPRGWQLVGKVALDAPDLAEALSYLRSTALGLSPRGMTTKLVIPNSQVLYTQVSAPAPDGVRRRKQVARGLQGLTPYDVEDLAFDIWGTGPEAQVAVIAKETLAEAEAFAQEHRFNPVSFVAVPDNGRFLGEPWFGPTSCAADYLPEGQKVERDRDPIEILTRDVPLVDPGEAPEADTPDAAGGDTPSTEDDAARVEEPVADGDPPFSDAADQSEASVPEAVVPVAAMVDLADELPVAVADPVAVQPEAVSAEALPDADTPAPVVAPVAESVAFERNVSDAPPAEPTVPPRLQPSPPAPVQARPAPPSPVPPLPSSVSATVQAPPPAAFVEPASAPVAEEAPIALDVVDDLPDPAPPMAASVLDPSIPEDLPPPPASSIMMAFASRRAAEADAGKVASVKNGPGKTAQRAPAIGSVTATRTGPSAKVTTLPPRTLPPNVTTLPSRSAEASPSAGGKSALKGAPPGKPPRGLSAPVTAPGIPGSRERRPVVQIVTPPAGPTTSAAAAAATLSKPGAKPYSGGLGNRSLADRGKPRYLGLILTGILLVFLALVAAWSTLFLETRDTTTPQTEAVADAGPAASTPAGSVVTDLPSVEDEALADLQDPAEIAAEAPAEVAVADTPAETPAAPVLQEPVVPEPVPPQPEPVAEVVPEPETAPVTNLDSETAAARQPAADPQDEIFLAAMDAPPEMPDALSLPRPTELNDPAPAPAVPPPPFGTVYRFDAQGQIIPTPEGILTPEGVLLIAGPPPLVPPQRPAALTPPPADAAPEAAAAAAATDAVAVPASDPALAEFRPRPRPETLTPPTQNADDDASLAPAEGSRFASLRPQARPGRVVAEAAEEVAPTVPLIDLGAQGASLTAQAAANAAQSSPLVLAVSRKPAQRPRDMSRAVEEAVAVASRQPDPAPPADPPAQQAAPEADNEPEVATAMPRLPTKASVSKQATFANAINLSKVNLIGVYGTQSNRHALIRQTNGRYKKVKVGDSLDGGRVAAITASEVRYQKSGRMVTLALPKG